MAIKHKVNRDMKTRRFIVGKMLGLGAALSLCLGSSMAVQAASAEVQANKAVVERYVKALGAASFESVRGQTEARDHKQLRHEFENLKYNASNSELARMADPDAKAIPDRVNTIAQILGEGDMVAVRFRVKGTHKGNLYGIPASGKSIDMEAAGFFRLANGRIVESWLMAEEAKLLRDVGSWLPARKDGKLVVPPHYNDTRGFDVALKELTAKPVDSQEYRHKAMLMAYKFNPRPAERAYGELLRGGIDNIVQRAAELNVKGSHGQSIKDRVDTLGYIVAEGNGVIFNFRLNAINAGPLYGIPPSNNPMHDWEVNYSEFDGDKWTKAWWMADEVGFLTTIGNAEATRFLVGETGARKP